MPCFTVILLQYNPDRGRLFRTINSILRQKDVTIQLIITDDGSVTDFFTDIDYALKDKGIEYLCIKNEKNVGTVKNFWNALQKAKYGYISFISPGDYYYDEHVLSSVFNKMQEDDVKFLFGKISPYRWEDNGLKIVDRQWPINTRPYRHIDNNSYKKIKRNLFIYNDIMGGPALFFEKGLLIEYLRRIVDRVICAEDLITRFILLDELKFSFLDQYVIWYEYGVGISMTKDNSEKIDRDILALYDVLFEYYPNSKLLQKAKKLDSIVRIGGIKSFLLRSILFPDRLLYLFYHTYIVKERNKPENTDFILELYKTD